MRPSYLLVCIAGSAVFCLPCVKAVKAQQARFGDLYVGIGAGAVFTQSTSFNATGSISGISIAGSGRLSFNPGELVVAFASYSITPIVNVVAQLGYVHARIADFTGELSFGYLGPIAGTIGTAGDVGTLANLYNIVVTPLGQDTTFIPYFGGGVGFAHSHAALRTISVLGSTIPIDVNSSDTDLAADILIGADYKFSSRARLGLVYQFVRISAGDLGSEGSLHANTGAVLSHFLGALFEYRF